jgi:hypothetical protein
MLLASIILFGASLSILIFILAQSVFIRHGSKHKAAVISKDLTQLKAELVKAFTSDNVILKNDSFAVICNKTAIGLVDSSGSFLVMKDGNIYIQPALTLHLAPFQPQKDAEDKLALEGICRVLQD